MQPTKSKNSPNWLADFSLPMRIFTVILVAEIMVVIYSLSFLSFDFQYLNQLAELSLLAQLIAITLIVILSKLYQYLNRLSVIPGVLSVLFITIVLAAVYTQLMAWIDHALMFGLFRDPTLTTVRISLATSLTLLTLLRYFYIQNLWANQIEALAKAQMNALQARIKPHFLYNSLNSIAALIAFDSKSAEQAVLNLSGLFRKAFANNKESMTCIENELEWIDEYLAIEKLRLMERLQFKSTIDEELLNIKIPLLSIQPLIENAVIHGIQHLVQGGCIDLTIKKTAHGFYVEVKNPVCNETSKPGNQTGLNNIKSRLELAYGNHLEFNIQKHDNEFVVRWEVLK